MDTHPGVVIRPGVPADIESALALLHAANQVRSGGQMGFGNGRERLASAETLFVVAESSAPSADRVLIGVAAGIQARADGGAGAAIIGLCHITMVAVHPDYWGRGIGGQLVRALISQVRAHGYDRAQLFTQVDNARAQRLYTSLGFALSGETAVSAEGEAIARWVLEPLP